MLQGVGEVEGGGFVWGRSNKQAGYRNKTLDVGNKYDI